MSHFNNDIARTVDALNREGFERLMDYFLRPVGTFLYYNTRYRGSAPLTRYFLGLLWRLALTLIPVLPAIYCVNRILGVVLNPLSWYNNFPKPALMTLTLGLVGTGVYFLSWPATVSALTSIVPYASAITGLVPGGVLAAGVLALGSAFLLYGAKQLARYFTAMHCNEPGQTYRLTTRKHIIKPEEDNNPDEMHTAYQTALHEHIKLKTELKFNPTRLVPRASTLSTFKEIDAEYYIRGTEETLLRGKAMLAQFETVIRSNGTNATDEGDLNEEDHALLTEARDERKLGSYLFWRKGVEKIDPDFEGGLPETQYNDHRKFVIL